jgi:hypothetical protein
MCNFMAFCTVQCKRLCNFVSNMYNYSLCIQYAISVTLCKYGQIYANMCNHTQILAILFKHMQLCESMCNFVQQYGNLYSIMQICVILFKFVQIFICNSCANMCNFVQTCATFLVFCAILPNHYHFLLLWCKKFFLKAVNNFFNR